MSESVKSSPPVREEFLEVGLFRVVLGMFLLLYHAKLFLELKRYFGPGSMIDPHYFNHSFSLLFYVWNTSVIFVLMAVLLVLLGFFTAGKITRLFFIILYVLQVSFYHANALIVHDVQPMANLFLLTFFFLPLDTPPVLGAWRASKMTESRRKNIQAVTRVLVAFLGIYYAIACFKKLPDPMWRDGTAIWSILNFPPVSRVAGIDWLMKIIRLLSPVATFASLVFEGTFLLLVFTRFRPAVIVTGLVFHIGILLLMEVGGFSVLMLSWYMLLLDEETRRRFRGMFRKFPFGNREAVARRL